MPLSHRLTHYIEEHERAGTEILDLTDFGSELEDLDEFAQYVVAKNFRWFEVSHEVSNRIRQQLIDEPNRVLAVFNQRITHFLLFGRPPAGSSEALAIPDLTEYFYYDVINEISNYISPSLRYFSNIGSFFVGFGCLAVTEDERKLQRAIGRIKIGWKFHISIDDINQENIEAGWNLIKDIMISERIMTGKIVRRGENMGATPKHCGKQITVYMFHNPEKNQEHWLNIFREITFRLATNNIQPSFRSPGDYPLNGSNYITYRYDDGREAPVKQPPRRTDDPFIDQSVIVPVEQPAIPSPPNSAESSHRASRFK